jgi:hypothetical protein
MNTPKRKVLGLNSARLYTLNGAGARAVGQYGSAYKQGKIGQYETAISHHNGGRPHDHRYERGSLGLHMRRDNKFG